MPQPTHSKLILRAVAGSASGAGALGLGLWRAFGEAASSAPDGRAVLAALLALLGVSLLIPLGVSDQWHTGPALESALTKGDESL